LLEVTLRCTGLRRSAIFLVHVDTTVSSPSELNKRVDDRKGVGLRPALRLGAPVAQRLALARAWGRAA
jgi:hypothetical protein